MTNQNDFIIDNGTGFAVRQDIQDALQALAGNSSGNSEPSVKYAYQWWADTNANVMKLRNSGNTAWITLFQLDGTLTLEDGSASAPALSFRDDPNTGIYSAANDRFNIAVGGTDYLEIKTDVIVFNDTGADTDFKVEGDTNPELFYVDAGEDRIGINTSTPNTKLHIVAPNLNTGTINATNCKQLGLWVAADAGNSNTTNDIYTGIALGEGHAGMYGFDGGGSAATGLGFFTGNASATSERMRIDGAGDIKIGESNSGAVALSLIGDGGGILISRAPSGTPTSGQYLGQVGFNAYSSSQTLASADALIRAVADDNHSGTSASSNLSFFTKPATTGPGSAPTERLKIHAGGNVSIIDGNLIIPNGHGIDFSASGNNVNMTSEVFDGYEEGTWTPTVGYQNSSGLTIATNSHAGKYTKIGRLVHCIGAINFTVSGSPVNDNIAISGLPFNTGTGAVGTGDTRFAGCNIRIQNTSDDTSIYMAGVYGNFAVNLGVQQDMGNRANEIGGNSGMIVRVQIWYHTE